MENIDRAPPGDLCPNHPDDEVVMGLADAIRQSIRCEQEHEDRAEKVVCIPAQDGRVLIPRTGAFVATNKPSMLITGTDDYVFKDFIEKLLPKLHQSISTTTDAPSFEALIRVLPRQPKVQGQRLTSLGRKIVDCCRSYDPAWGVAYASHRFNPTITLMLRAMRSYARSISRQGLVGEGGICWGDLPDQLRRLVRFIRRVSCSWSFINALNNDNRQAQDNFDSAAELIFHFAENDSKLLILRLDLFFKPYHEAEEARKAIEGFLRWLRSRACRSNLLHAYLGFVIKQECGLVRGTHWHLLLVCKGNVQCKGAYLTEELGKKWAERTRQGVGCYFNCFANRKFYRNDALGILELHDHKKMIGLRQAIFYLSKQQCVLKASEEKAKMFWRTPIPRTCRTKRGRPRVQQESLRLLKQMLGGKRSKYPPGFDPPRYPRYSRRSSSQEQEHDVAESVP